jgi:hypothetical protein
MLLEPGIVADIAKAVGAVLGVGGTVIAAGMALYKWGSADMQIRNGYVKAQSCQEHKTQIQASFQRIEGRIEGITDGIRGEFSREIRRVDEEIKGSNEKLRSEFYNAIGALHEKVNETNEGIARIEGALGIKKAL